MLKVTLTALPCGWCAAAEGCVKLANGHNWRSIQPINGRPIKLAT